MKSPGTPLSRLVCLVPALAFLAPAVLAADIGSFAGSGAVPRASTARGPSVAQCGWDDTSLDDPSLPVREAAMVWTGTEVLIWGGDYGYRFDPIGGTFAPMSTRDAPLGFGGVFAWTGTELIVWGGRLSRLSDATTNAGARYDPAQDRWSPMSTDDAPSPRADAAASWTGSRLIVWGGRGDDGVPVGDGRRYDPATDTWSTVADTGAPEARALHSAIWTGAVMLVYGGESATNNFLKSGGAYDPATNGWTALPAPPTGGRRGHSAAWTGTEMLVFGGESGGGATATGRRYDPGTQMWGLFSDVGAPAPAATTRAVWNGARLLAFGGAAGTGGVYDPGSDTWDPVTDVSAPTDRAQHALAWTGDRLMVWGGGTGTGALWDPTFDSWSPTEPAPPNRASAFGVSVWTGAEWIHWGGVRPPGLPGPDGFRYDPVSDSFGSMTTANEPAERTFATAVWSGSEMIVWGGQSTADSSTRFDDGGRYDPATDTWTPVSTTNAPEARTHHRAVWTGTRMVVWGGWTGTARDVTSTGARYDAATDSWSPTSLAGAPSARRDHTMVWTGTEVLVWGGYDDGTGTVLSDGARYDPDTDTWSPMADSTTGSVGGRFLEASAWTGTELIVFGGLPFADGPGSGGRYDPSTDVWQPIATTGAPAGRRSAAAAWSGRFVIVFGGQTGSFAATTSYLDDVGLYDPLTDSWLSLPRDPRIGARSDATAGDAGGRFLTFGGTNDGGEIAAGGVLRVETCDADTDGDGVVDAADNCPATPNPGQEDADQDGVGDVCTPGDDDGDGVDNLDDNCPTIFNPLQENLDLDGLGDACDDDRDGDGVDDPADNCPAIGNPGQEDGDLDGIGDACDAHPDCPASADDARRTVLGDPLDGIDATGFVLGHDSSGDPLIGIARSGGHPDVAGNPLLEPAALREVLLPAGATLLGRFGDRLVFQDGTSAGSVLYEDLSTFTTNLVDTDPLLSGDGRYFVEEGGFTADAAACSPFTTAWFAATGTGAADSSFCIDDRFAADEDLRSPELRGDGTWFAYEIFFGNSPIDLQEQCVVRGLGHDGNWSSGRTEFCGYPGIIDREDFAFALWSFVDFSDFESYTRLMALPRTGGVITLLQGGSGSGSTTGTWFGASGNSVAYRVDRPPVFDDASLSFAGISPSFDTFLTDDEQLDDVSIASDDSAVAYRSGSAGVVRVQAQGGSNLLQLSEPVDEFAITGSPDSHLIFLAPPGGGPSELFTQPVSGGAATQISLPWQPGALRSLQLLPVAGRVLLLGELTPGRTDLYSMLPDGADLRRVTPTDPSSSVEELTTALTGWIVFRRGGGGPLELAPLPGGDAQPLQDATAEAPALEFEVLADGSALIYLAAVNGGDTEVFRFVPDAVDASQTDDDGDGRCARIDNCPTTSNANQSDTDVDGSSQPAPDGVGDACDNCPRVPNADQADGDVDGVGDTCDCAPAAGDDGRPPAVGGVRFQAPAEAPGLTWTDVSLATEYRILRGDLALLPAGDYGTCIASVASGVQSVVDPESPSAGVAWFYLVLGVDDVCGPGLLGPANPGQRETPLSACP